MMNNETPTNDGTPENPVNPEPESANPAPESAIPAPEIPKPVDPIAPPAQTGGMYTSRLELVEFAEKLSRARAEVKKFLVGQEELVDLLYAGILSNGHILLEGVPGIAKTLTAKLVSRTIAADFSRLQFTPDMMPSDITGSSVYNAARGEFVFKKGPVFSNIILIDEINRAPAKTQAALFEVMEERQITFDGVTYPMDFPFLVIATQNPVEQEGTYRLPEAQLDRFLFKVILSYPTLEEETEILIRFRNNIASPDLSSVQPVLRADEIRKMRGIVEQVTIENHLLSYIARITESTRNHGRLYLGASPRASLAMMRSAKAIAAMRGRDFVTPDDIQYVAPHVLNHRIMLNPESEMEGLRTLDIVKDILEKIQVPR
jgi:MoxR-like ATPase